MKRIILSLGALVFVGALVVGATGAFFSDTESSIGNTFTAGAIDLTVDSEQHYNGNVCDDGFWSGESEYPVPGTPCGGTWEATNLGAQHKFFDFGDVKPGDEGENTISLHIDSNPAWACADVSITSNDDVSTVDPETDAGDDLEIATSTFDGELAQNIWFVAWRDMANATSTNPGTPGDNIWQGAASEPLFFTPGPASNILNSGTTTLALADLSTGGIPLPGGDTSYIGLAWCAGTLSTAGDVISCNGATMGNIAQTDSMTANLAFRVEQSRNNANFLCSPNQ